MSEEKRKSRGVFARTAMGCTTGVASMAAVEIVGRLSSEGMAAPGLGGYACVGGVAVFLGALVGTAAGLLLKLATVRGPAWKSSVGTLLAIANYPIKTLLPVLLVAAVFLLVLTAIRAAVLKNQFLAPAVDLITFVAVWVWLVSMMGKSRESGRKINPKILGIVLIVLGVVGGVSVTGLRSTLVPSGLWDLALLGIGACVAVGVTALAPARILSRFVLPGVVLSIGMGALSLYYTHSNVQIRGAIASDFRPTNWVVSGMTVLVDFDWDGFSPLFGGGDCDDFNEDVNPGGLEIPGNGIDENCSDGDNPVKRPWPKRPTFLTLPNRVAEPQSILLITIDTLRPDHMGMYGYLRNTTPHMDEFAKEATRFELAYSTAPTTRVAIPTLMAGRSLGEISWDRSVFPYRMRDTNETMAELAREKGLKTAAFVTHRWLGKGWGFAQGFSHVDEKLALDEEVYRTTATGRKLATSAARWIERNREERFFVWVHFMDPHSRHIKHNDGTDWGLGRKDRYDSEIEYVDKEVKRLLQTLKEHGIYDSTAVVVAADHGEFLGEHGRFAHGGSGIWQEGARIPLLIRLPGLKPGVSKCITPLTDVAPTLLNMVGIDGGKHGMSGASLLGEMAGTECDLNREIVLELKYGPRTASNVRALVGHKWKLWENVKRNTYKLFDLQNDPKEQRDLARVNREKTLEMRKRLSAWSGFFTNREYKEMMANIVKEALPDGVEAASARFENGVELVGYDFGPRAIDLNNPIDARLFLRRTAEVSKGRCMAWLYLTDGKGEVVKEAKHAFVNGTFPMHRWPRGKVIEDAFAFEIRANDKLVTGTYDLSIKLKCGWWTIDAIDGDIDDDERVRAGQIAIKETKKQLRRKAKRNEN